MSGGSVHADPVGTSRIARAVTQACLIEARAPKPGNVSPGRPFHDTSHADFVASAHAIGPVLGEAGVVPLGEVIHGAVTATRMVTRANTNLGIILLLAPLAAAAARGGELRAALRQVLGSTTVDDAAAVYRAIRLAAPAGLGAAPEQDIASAPSVTLREAMQLAAHRDTIAREYTGDFALTFGIGAPALRAALREGLTPDEAMVETALRLLAVEPDAHIARKLGQAEARRVSAEAERVLEAGGVRTEHGRAALAAFDAALRDERNRRNPGTTADCCAAAAMVVILADGWHPEPQEH